MQRGNDITGILLAGGKSSRMGREKGLIRLGKGYLYQYPLKVLEHFCNEILISTCNKLNIRENYQQICDEVPGRGPAGGISTCLQKSSSELNIILSYDLPFVDIRLVRFLIDSMEDYDVVVPTAIPGKVEPLCGIYRKQVGDTMKELIASGEYAVHKVFQKVKTRIIAIDDSFSFYHSRLFLNINSEEDLSDLSGDF